MNRQTIKFVWSWVKPYFGIALLGVLLTIPVGALDAAVAAFLRPYMDQVVLGKSAAWSAFIPILIILFTVVQGSFTYSSAYVNAWVGNKIAFQIKRQLYRQLLTFDVSYFDRTDSGTVLLRFSHDAEIASAGLINNVRFFLTRLFSTISLMVVMFYNSWWLALIAISVVAIAFYPLKIARRKMRMLQTKSEFSGAGATTIYNETYSGNRTISAYNLQRQQEKKFNHVMDDMFRTSMRITRHTNWLSPVMHIIVSFGLAFVLGLGGWLVINNHMTGGSFTAFIAALLMMYTPIKSIGNNVVGIQASLLAIERIYEIMHWTPLIPNTFDEGIRPLAIKNGIHFDNISFEYRPDMPVLKGINFEIPMGQSVGIVGNSGGGKTSLIHLLARLYDVNSGAIRIDGKDIREIPLAQLRQSIAMVFQDNFLFSGSIRENILLGNPDANGAELNAAVENAYLSHFIDTLPQGIDTQVGERGILLSGGQKQRVAIARAMIRNAPIIILDEATSALDNQSEAIVQKALDNLIDGKTVLIIAHRLSTLRNTNCIFVLEAGQIIESGTQRDLLSHSGGAFSCLYNAQFRTPENPEKKSP